MRSMMLHICELGLTGHLPGKFRAGGGMQANEQSAKGHLEHIYTNWWRAAAAWQNTRVAPRHAHTTSRSAQHQVPQNSLTQSCQGNFFPWQLCKQVKKCSMKKKHRVKECLVPQIIVLGPLKNNAKIYFKPPFCLKQIQQWKNEQSRSRVKAKKVIIETPHYPIVCRVKGSPSKMPPN